ncbi:MAG: RNA-binding S4 domain-containing protein [Clostridia bacterium]
MRLDKFLKISRIIKRRTVAKAVCDQGKVKINGRPAKAGSDVDVGDDIEVDFGSKIVTFKVLDTLSHASKKQASTMYEVIDEKHVI